MNKLTGPQRVAAGFAMIGAAVAGCSSDEPTPLEAIESLDIADLNAPSGVKGPVHEPADDGRTVKASVSWSQVADVPDAVETLTKRFTVEDGTVVVAAECGNGNYSTEVLTDHRGYPVKVTVKGTNDREVVVTFSLPSNTEREPIPEQERVASPGCTPNFFRGAGIDLGLTGP